MDLNQEQQVIGQAVKEAGDLLFEQFKTFDRHKIRLKNAREIVTESDLLSEKIILSAINNNFPDHGILSEEQGANNKTSDWLWAIDPLDGTTNFAMHNPLWCISAGLFYKKTIVLALIYAPMLQELYQAIHGQGAWLNGQKLKVSDLSTGQTLNSFCWGREEREVKTMLNYFAYQKAHGFGLRHLGTAAIELAFVATGRLESFIVPGAKLWDVAAGVLLVREAGGEVSDFVGQDWTSDSLDLVASNGLIHDQVLIAIKHSRDEQKTSNN
ncbi:MAG: inositol monophosphatase family protein [bacterium]